MLGVFGASFRSLHFAARPRVLARYLGQIFLVLACLTVVPALVSLAGGNPRVALRYGVVVVLFGALGGAGARLRCTERVQANEALAISALTFAISGLAMAYPMSAYGIDPVDAVFESISGVTTTGLSTLGSIEGRPRAFLFGRAWLQWVGGLGVVVLALAIIIPSGAAARRLGFDEREAADYVGGTRGHARRILVVYLALTVAGFALCWSTGQGWFDALAHTLAAVSTGGFSTSDRSIAALPPAARSAVSFLCLAGAVSFSLYYRASIGRALRDSRLWSLLGLTLVGAVVLAASGSWSAETTEFAGWGQAAWLAVSAQSTAGFSSLSVADLPSSSKLVLIAGMVVGGDVGSTAGGLKILRLIILFQLVAARILRASIPRTSHLPPRVGGSRVQSDEVEAAAALALAYGVVVLASWLVFLLHGHDPLPALFDVVSATSTVGLSAGTTGPDLEPLLKGVLCIDMLIGRVEIFAFFVAVFPGTWIGRRRSSR